MRIVEEMVLEQITAYRESILSGTMTDDDTTENLLQEQIDDKEAFLYKLKKALDRLNDSYEMGDYERDEWLERKKKREAEIYRTKNEIYELKKRSENKEQITNAESIIWLRQGDTIDVKINFK